VQSVDRHFIGKQFSTVYSQFVKFAIIGVISNLILYFLYILITFIGLGPKLAMTISYLIGVTQTFLFNRKWTFKYNGSARQSMVRYIVSYGIGYCLNFIVLLVLVDKIGWPHQAVQGVMVLLLACILFLLQKFWVFR